jgi:CBS domain-containing protein
MKVDNVMTVNPVSAPQTASVKKIAELMRDCRIGAILITDSASSKHLAGIVTDRDLCTKVLAEGMGLDTPVSKVMTTRPVTCDAGESLGACETLMQLHEVRRIPIIDSHRNILGIVTASDLAQHDTAQNLQRTVRAVARPRRKSVAAASRKAS